MSSDSEFEPTPPKQRRLSKSQMSGNENSVSPVVKSERNRQCINVESDNEVFILSDDEIDRTSESGNPALAARSNSESPPIVTLDPSSQCETVPGTSKRTAEMRDTEAGIDSDSSDSEKCPICWLPYTNQEVATPTICDHRFCFHCIVEWSRTMNTCPVDRQVFSSITVRPKFGSKVTRLVPIETQRRADTDDDTEEHDPDDDDDDDGENDDNYAGIVAYNIAEEDYFIGLFDAVEELERINAATEESIDTTYSTEGLTDHDAIRMALQYSFTDDDGDDDDDDDGGSSGDDGDGRDDSEENADVEIVPGTPSSSNPEEPDIVFSSQYNDWSLSSATSSLAFASPNVSYSPPASPSPYISVSSSASLSSSPPATCSPSPVSLSSATSSSSPPPTSSPSPVSLSPTSSSSSPAILPSPAPSPSPSPSPSASSVSLSDYRSLSPATSSSASY